MTMIELTKEELQAVAGGGQNHGQATSEAVHWAQDYVRTNGGQMGTQVSYFARNGLAPP
jgi:bacteriocin-like protein